MEWRIVVTDIATGRETVLSPPGSIEAMPEWSSDGKLVVFWKRDPRTLRKLGILTMTPDGRDRRLVPLPVGYRYKRPSFFPGEGSSPAARIMFGIERDG